MEKVSLWNLPKAEEGVRVLSPQLSIVTLSSDHMHTHTHTTAYIWDNSGGKKQPGLTERLNMGCVHATVILATLVDGLLPHSYGVEW